MAKTRDLAIPVLDFILVVVPIPLRRFDIVWAERSLEAEG
jgi:hypothetical protein